MTYQYEEEPKIEARAAAVTISINLTKYTAVINPDLLEAELRALPGWPSVSLVGQLWARVSASTALASATSLDELAKSLANEALKVCAIHIRRESGT